MLSRLQRTQGRKEVSGRLGPTLECFNGDHYHKYSQDWVASLRSSSSCFIITYSTSTPTIFAIAYRTAVEAGCGKFWTSIDRCSS